MQCLVLRPENKYSASNVHQATCSTKKCRRGGKGVDVAKPREWVQGLVYKISFHRGGQDEARKEKKKPESQTTFYEEDQTSLELKYAWERRAVETAVQDKEKLMEITFYNRV